MLNKKIVIELPSVYTVNEFYLGDQIYIAAGSEQKNPAYLINPENNFIIKVADDPGGMMSIMPVPGRSDQLVSVMGLFPPFIGFEAGIYFHVKKNQDWTSKKVISLPFSHRCEIVKYGGENHLFIATVSSHKDNPGDWSKPGALYHVVIDKEGSGIWQPELILNNLFRNHGMNKCMIGDMEMVCISGAEGIFSIQPGVNGNWIVTQLFDHEVSEFSFFDLDNDGIDELVTIEPFHGNSLNIYKKNSSGWQSVYNSPLSFGHGLGVGKFQDQNVVVVGNRRDSGDLELHKIHNLSRIEKNVIENNVGPTQIKVFRDKGVDFILSSNQGRNEVVLYY